MVAAGVRRAVVVVAVLWAAQGFAQAAAGPTGSAEAYQASYDAEALGSYEAALLALERLPLTHREAYLAQLRRGWLNTRLGRWQEAAQGYERAVAVMPGSVEARLGLLTALIAQRRWADAEAIARQVLDRDADNYTATVKLAFIAYSQGRHAEAEATYRRLVALYPGDLEVRSGVAWAALKQGKTAEAAKAFRELLEVAPKQPYAAEGLKLALDSKK